MKKKRSISFSLCDTARWPSSIFYKSERSFFQLFVIWVCLLFLQSVSWHGFLILDRRDHIPYGTESNFWLNLFTFTVSSISITSCSHMKVKEDVVLLSNPTRNNKNRFVYEGIWTQVTELSCKNVNVLPEPVYANITRLLSFSNGFNCFLSSWIW